VGIDPEIPSGLLTIGASAGLLSLVGVAAAKLVGEAVVEGGAEEVAGGGGGEVAESPVVVTRKASIPMTSPSVSVRVMVVATSGFKPVAPKTTLEGVSGARKLIVVPCGGVDVIVTPIAGEWFVF